MFKIRQTKANMNSNSVDITISSFHSLHFVI